MSKCYRGAFRILHRRVVANEDYHNCCTLYDPMWASIRVMRWILQQKYGWSETEVIEKCPDNIDTEGAIRIFGDFEEIEEEEDDDLEPTPWFHLDPKSEVSCGVTS